ncbi:8407_t:CDS:2 [Dentiscutata erythropus]|uniref:Poly [ADP-ribose] polymerase n=1 Tax=Dentiscutata erythropus TaxID=1348616 RepID=A0A9N9C7K9_9GLOM|nr:8407_t:CDS:2 [Dentiscutata erythropus]
MEEFIVQTDQVKSILEVSNISTDSNFIQQEPFLYKLHEEDRDYKYVSELFLSSWKHLDKPVPTIVSIWKVYCAKELITRYELYRKSVGNECKLFHGTKTTCTVGFENGGLCIEKSCSICCIIREGYKLDCARYGLFGKGIYFSTTSSKCDNFNANLLEKYNGVNYKVMLLNNVVLGRIYKPLENGFSLTSPPPGYDSVCGDPNIVKNLKDLKHDEIIVYKEEASIPQFLIVYQTKANY